MVNVLCVCAVGVGSSLMLKMNAEKAVRTTKRMVLIVF